jgi:hypothetical protein
VVPVSGFPSFDAVERRNPLGDRTFKVKRGCVVHIVLRSMSALRRNSAGFQARRYGEKRRPTNVITENYPAHKTGLVSWRLCGSRTINFIQRLPQCGAQIDRNPKGVTVAKGYQFIARQKLTVFVALSAQGICGFDTSFAAG